MSIDKLGKCPNCGTEWDGGDISDTLNRLEVFMHKNNDEVSQLAKSLGYSAFNKNRFSKTISHEINGVALIECPNISCGHIFNVVTEEEYKSLYDYSVSKIIEMIDIEKSIITKTGGEIFKQAIADYINENPEGLEEVADKDLLKELKEYKLENNRENFLEQEKTKEDATKKQENKGDIKSRSNIFYKPKGRKWGR